MQTPSVHAQRIEGYDYEFIAGELVLVHAGSGKVHALNDTAAAVWEACDGQRSLAEISAAASEASGLEISEQLAELAVSELADAGIVSPPNDTTLVSRRAYLQRFGQAAAAAAALPVIHSIVAPSPAAAQSDPFGGGGGGGTTTTPTPTTTGGTTPAPTTTGGTTPPPTTTGGTTPPPTTTSPTTPPPTTPPPTTTAPTTTPPPTTTLR